MKIFYIGAGCYAVKPVTVFWASGGAMSDDYSIYLSTTSFLC